MKKVFEKVEIGTLELKNRIVRSATWEGMCNVDGRPTDKLTKYYEQLAAGGVGLIVFGYTFVALEGKQQVGMAGIYTDDFADEFKAVTNAVHREGGKVVIQLVHAGGQANFENSGYDTVAPSAIESNQYNTLPKELTEAQVESLITAFADGASRAKSWGFDGVQLHAAHGYLINQFLSPLTNRRTDRWGGDLTGRSRFLMEVIKAVRARVGDDYPLMIKLNADDNLDGGFSQKDAAVLCRHLDEILDAIELSSGCAASGSLGPARTKINSVAQEGYNADFAIKIKKTVSVPIISVGGFRTYEKLNQVLKDGVDFVSMSRPFIFEPDLVNRWQSGDTAGAKCISCNRCFITGVGGGIYCVQKRKLDYKKAKKEKDVN